jgi:DNA-binding transcriptional LysR family regulator
MSRTSLDNLRILAIVARERSFTRAASLLNVPQSTVSRAIKLLEERLDTRLLDRTTRSVSLTDAGQRLMQGIGPALDTIDTELTELTGQLGQPGGTLRITTVRHAFETVLRPILPSFLTDHPKITVEVAIDDAFSDIVAERFDAGIRFGGLVEKDMIALRVGPDVRAAIVASPAYIARHGMPGTPNDLFAHRCINYRTAKAGGLYRWWFQNDGSSSEVRVEGRVTLNDGDTIIGAALDGLGIAYTFDDRVQELVAQGSLVSLLSDWCPIFSGYHIYYSSRRHMPAGLKALTEKLQRNRRRD